MSLLDESFEKCVYMNKIKVLDEYGGYTNTWSEGAPFDAAITFNTSIQARIGEKEGASSRYTVTTRKVLTLEYNDYFKRLKDNKYFHVTSDGDDLSTPASASLDMRCVEAEEIKVLPT